MPQNLLLTEERLQTLLDTAAARGAREALAIVGLDDAVAAGDIRELRLLLEHWKTLNRAAFRRIALWALGLVLIVVTLWLMPHVRAWLGNA